MISVLLILAVVLTDLLYRSSHDFLIKTSQTALVNLGGVAGLKIVCGLTPSLEGLSDILDRILNFLLLSNLMILLQLILLELSRAWAVKILLLAVFGLFLIPRFRFRHAALKIGIVLLMINPGLSLYVSAVNLLSRSAAIEMGSKISKELQIATGQAPGQTGSTNRSDTGPVDIPAEVSNRSTPPEAGFWPRLKTIIDQGKLSIRQAGGNFAQTMQTARYLAAGALDRLLEFVLNYFVSVLILFILLPFAYFYVVLTLLKDLIQSLLADRP